MRQMVIMNAIIGIVLAILSLPMIANKIKPNPLYGYRVKRTLENPQIWYQVNQYAGKQLFAAGVLISLFSVGTAILPGMNLQVYSLIIAVVNLSLITIAVIRSTHFLNSL
jgi:predicted Kef-type K+ transport protein